MKKNFGGLKKLLALALVAVTVMGTAVPSIQVEAAKKKSSGATYAVGDDIAFGHIDGTIISWTILTYDDTTKTAFVVASKGLNTISINNYRKAIENSYKAAGKTPGYVRWSENYWRGWLNQTFYKVCFNDAERAKILKTTLTAEAAKDSLMNFYHDTSLDAYYVANGKKNAMFMDIYESQTTSVDYIFFLSTDEYTANKDTLKMDNSSWPLRTNAYDDPGQGLFVNETTKLIERRYYYGGPAIRPAMYVKLGEVTEEASDKDTKSTDTKKSTSAVDAVKTATAKSTTTTASTAKTTTTSTTKTTTKKASTKSFANNGTNIGNITLPDDASYTLKPGGTAQVALDMDYLNSTDKQYNVTYKSSDANVFTVDSSGKITAVATGTANITVRMKKSNGKVYTMSCRIDVS